MKKNRFLVYCWLGSTSLWATHAVGAAKSSDFDSLISQTQKKDIEDLLTGLADILSLLKEREDVRLLSTQRADARSKK